MTLPLILLYNRSSNKEKRFIEYLINKEKVGKKDFFDIVKRMNKYNVQNDCLDKAKHFSLMAKDSLGLFPNSEEKDKITNLINYLLFEKKIVSWNNFCTT